MSAALSVFKLSVQSVCQLQKHRIEVSYEITRLPYQCTPVNKSFHIDSKAVFSSAMLVGFGVYSVSVSHLT